MVRRRFPIFLFSLLMLLDVAVFLLQKLASNHSNDAARNYLLDLAMHPWVWMSILLAPLQLLVWTRILARAEISLAFPLTSLSVPLTMIASIWVLGEKPSWEVWIGALLMTAGAMILKPLDPPNDRAVQAEIISGT